MLFRLAATFYWLQLVFKNLKYPNSQICLTTDFVEKARSNQIEIAKTSHINFK